MILQLELFLAAKNCFKKNDYSFFTTNLTGVKVILNNIFIMIKFSAEKIDQIDKLTNLNKLYKNSSSNNNLNKLDN